MKKAFLMLTLGLVLAAPSWALETRYPLGWPTIPSENYTFTPPGVDNPTLVAIFRDNLPWGSDTDDQILIANLIGFTVFNASDIGVVDLSPFDKVILSSQQPVSFATTVQANRAWFESYVSSGGCLLQSMAHFFSDFPVGTTYPGGYVYDAQNCNEIVTITAPAHPIFNSPNVIPSGALQGWGCSSHGPFSGPGVMLLQNADIDNGMAVAEHSLGQGFILTTSQPYQIRDANYAENLVLYFPCTGPVPVESSSWGSVKSLYR